MTEVGAVEVGVIEVGVIEVGALEVGAYEDGMAEISAVEVGTLALTTFSVQPQLMLLQDLIKFFSCNLLHGITTPYSGAGSICTVSLSSAHLGCRINQGRTSEVNWALQKL